MQAHKAAIAHTVVLIALNSAVAPAAEPVTARLKTTDVIELAERFATYNDALPDAAKLGMKRMTAFEEHARFVYAAGDLAGRKGKTAGARRVILIKPATLIVDDQLPTDAAASWTLEGPTLPNFTGRVATFGAGKSQVVCHPLLPTNPSVKIVGQMRGDAKPNRQVVEIPGAGRYVVGLHVGTGEDVRYAMDEKGDAVHVTIALGDRMCAVSLPSGDDAGTITIAENSRALLHTRPLAAGIMPHGPGGVKLIDQWDTRYRSESKPPWDTGIPEDKLVAAVEAGTLKPGRAVVLGCGSGTNAIYLASKGFDVTAMDVAPTALMIAKTKAEKAKVTVRWLLADVLAPPPVEPFDVIFDRGCYHGVRRVSAAGYVKTVDMLSKPGTMMLIHAGNANEASHYGPPRVDETQLVGDFAKTWDFVHLQEHRRGAWYWTALLRRRAE